MIWFAMTIFAFWVIPIILITYWNIRIIKELRKHAQELASTNSHSLTETSTASRNAGNSSFEETTRRHRDTDRRLTRMVILISMAYVFLALPLLIRTMYFLCEKPTNYSRKAMRFVVYHITNKLFMCNHAANFYLYCLSGARFRNDFFNLVMLPFKGFRNYWQRN